MSQRIYDNENVLRFVHDMIEAGLQPYHYRGRFFWEGPAVDVDSLQDGLSLTRIPCQWDCMGMGYVVYPVSSDRGVVVGEGNERIVDTLVDVDDSPDEDDDALEEGDDFGIDDGDVDEESSE